MPGHGAFFLLEKRMEMVHWTRRGAVYLVTIGLVLGLVVFPQTTRAQGIEELLYQELERSVLEDMPTSPTRPAHVHKNSGVISCLPTCDTTDGRFLAISPSNNLDTLSADSLEFELGVPAGTSAFSFGLFDGDTGATSAGGQHWDLGSASLEITLIADPQADGSGNTVIQTWTGVAAPDNDWIDFQITPDASAQSPSGNYFYRLRVALTDSSANALNAFKLRTDCVVTVEVFQQPIGFIAQLASLGDAQIIYPLYPAPVPTTYDGTLEFNLSYPVSVDEVVVWGGDMDHGDFTGLLAADTDDPDTPNNVLPPWAGPGAVLEGVAMGSGLSTGTPSDDRSPEGLGTFLLRGPSVTWELETPSGAIFANDNPSGNREWEQFRITSFPTGDADFDDAGPLGPGIYTVRLDGLDMQNLNAFYFFQPLVCVGDDGIPCQPLYPYALGDTVFEDLDGDGVQDPGEPGIAGVTIEVLDSQGEVAFTGVTGENGNYLVGVHNGESYTVRPASATFEPGGVLETHQATTAETMATTIQEANVLDLDFGYQPPPAYVHVFLEKEWRDDKLAVLGKTRGHHRPRTDVRIEATSELGTAVCKVEKSSYELDCDYDNDSPATDDSGLWVPVGSSYTVTEVEQRDGWEATAGTGTFTIGPDGPDYCEAGRDGIAKYCTHTVVNEPEGHSGPGTSSWIWWKHNPHQWPGSYIKVGGKTYWKYHAIYIMRYASFSDVRYNLFREVVAAKINRAVGNDSSCVDDEIAEADWYLYHTLKTHGTWSRMDQLRRHLARYNAGELCAPPRS